MTFEEANQTIRQAVAARMAGTPADDPKMIGYREAGCTGCEGHPFVAKAAAVAASLAETFGLPQEFVDATKHLTFRPASPVQPAEFRPERIAATMNPEQLEAAWAGVKAKREATLARIRGDATPTETVEITKPDRQARLIGMTGPAGCGKNLVASMVLGAAVVGFADPLYAMLSVLLGLPESWLRDRRNKDTVIEWLGKSPRQLLQTLGTEWGRGIVADDVWVRLASRRIDKLEASGTPVICIADVRFDNEAKMIRERGGEVWRVERTPASETYSHVSEAGIYVHLIDRVIDNTGTPDETRQQVAAALAAK